MLYKYGEGDDAQWQPGSSDDRMQGRRCFEIERIKRVGRRTYLGVKL